jgi:3-deoxy-D-arabino-heptulosonate 7-phosphate (DAHP) synthase
VRKKKVKIWTRQTRRLINKRKLRTRIKLINKKQTLNNSRKAKLRLMRARVKRLLLVIQPFRLINKKLKLGNSLHLKKAKRLGIQ